MTAPFKVVPLRIDPAPSPETVADLFKALDDLETAAKQVRAELDRCRQQHMVRTRCWGLDLIAYRREIEGRAA